MREQLKDAGLKDADGNDITEPEQYEKMTLDAEFPSYLEDKQNEVDCEVKKQKCKASKAKSSRSKSMGGYSTTTKTDKKACIQKELRKIEMQESSAREKIIRKEKKQEQQSMDCIAQELKKQGLTVEIDPEGKPVPKLPFDPATGKVNPPDIKRQKGQCPRKKYKNNHREIANAEHEPQCDLGFDDEVTHSEFNRVFDNYDGKPGKHDGTFTSNIWEDSPFKP